MEVRTFEEKRTLVRRHSPGAEVADYGGQDATHWHVPAWEGLIGSGPFLVAKADRAVTMLPSVPPWPQIDHARVGDWADDAD